MNILFSTVYAGLIPTTGVAVPTAITVEGIIAWAITTLIVVAGLIFLVMLLIGGLRWILSGGDKASTEAARGQVTAALIGLVIVFSAYAVVLLINAIFGIDVLGFVIPVI